MSPVSPDLVREQVCAELAVIDAAQARLRELSTDLVGNAFRLEMAERLETQDRVTRGLSYRVFGQLADPPDGPDDPGLPAGVKLIDLGRSGRITCTRCAPAWTGCPATCRRPTGKPPSRSWSNTPPRRMRCSWRWSGASWPRCTTRTASSTNRTGPIAGVWCSARKASTA